MTMVKPFTAAALIRAGNWKVTDLPPPVGKTTIKDLLSTAALTAFCCKGSPLKVRKALNPKKRFKDLNISKASLQ